MTNHEFKPSHSGMVCEQMVMRDGGGDACGEPPNATVHKPAPVIVQAEPGSRLDQLSARWAALKPAVDAAQAELKELTDAIKVELAQARPDAEDIRLTAGHIAGALRFYAKPDPRFNSRKFKAEQPEMYEKYYERDRTAWELRQTR